MSEKLEERIVQLVGEAGDIVERGSSVPEYERGGQLFATRPNPDTIELRLGAEIADAARRTPHTTVSERGPDWVRFAPSEWDKHALDRLEAWFRVAWRAAGKR